MFKLVRLFFAALRAKPGVETASLLSEPSREEVIRQIDERRARFEKRKISETPRIKEMALAVNFDGLRVEEVGDIRWLYGHDTDVVLLAVRISSGAFGVIGYDGNGFCFPKYESNHMTILCSLDHLPRLENDDEGVINVYFEKERYIMAEYRYDSSEQGIWSHSWRFTGVGCTGATACEAFERHGVSFKIEHD